MHRRQFMRSTGFAVIAGSGWLGGSASAQAGAANDLGSVLEGIREEHGLPGMAAAVVKGEKIVDAAVAGVRQVGTDDKIELDDRFLVGSCTKRMTATMVGRVIDTGKLTFDTTLADALPEMAMREEYRAVTVAQLLTFTAGLPPYMQVSREKTPILFELEGSAAQQRERFVKHLLQDEPVAKPGTERVYSNASYVVAAFVAARRTGRPWEQLMEEEVFKPLGMTRAGFGRPRNMEHPNEPRLHFKSDNGYQPEPEDGQQVDALAAMAGPGGVHCSIRDFAKFAGYELAAAQGNDRLLKPATSQRWRDLSRGGKVEGRPVRGGTQFITAGYVLWPSKNTAAAVTINGGRAPEACNAVFDAVERW